MKRYTVSVTSQNPQPSEVQNELYNYALLGWTLKSAITYLNDHIMLIFEREA